MLELSDGGLIEPPSSMQGLTTSQMMAMGIVGDDVARWQRNMTPVRPCHLFVGSTLAPQYAAGAAWALVAGCASGTSVQPLLRLVKHGQDQPSSSPPELCLRDCMLHSRFLPVCGSMGMVTAWLSLQPCWSAA
jgi:hypothetical protein